MLGSGNWAGPGKRKELDGSTTVGSRQWTLSWFYLVQYIWERFYRSKITEINPKAPKAAEGNCSIEMVGCKRQADVIKSVKFLGILMLFLLICPLAKTNGDRMPETLCSLQCSEQLCRRRAGDGWGPLWISAPLLEESPKFKVLLVSRRAAVATVTWFISGMLFLLDIYQNNRSSALPYR